MIRASRRAVLGAGTLGALAVPTISGLATWRWRHGDGRVLLHDPSLEAGRRFAEAGGKSRTIEGDRIRFARAVFAAKPALVAGVSRHADLVLIADVAAEMGYVLAAEFEGRGRQCSSGKCLPGWGALGRVAKAAGHGWAEALGSWAADPRGALPAPERKTPARPHAGLALGWVLVPRG
jgi:hypothetical protein